MAIAAASVFEVRTAGNDTNGGGFVTGAAGTDYSLQNSKNTVGTDISTADAVAVGTTTITSATANFGTTIVGNIIYFSGGTGSITGTWRQVTARASATSITVDASIAASTGMTMNIGGALLSPGQAQAIATVGGNVIFIKYNATPYSITSATVNIAGGCMSPNNPKSIIGYDTTRTILNTDVNRPTLQASGINTAIIITSTNAFVMYVANLIVDGASLTSIRGFDAAATLYNCKALGCTNNGFSINSNTAVKCEATGCSNQPAFRVINGLAINCVARANTVSGFDLQNNGVCVNCLSYSNTGASSCGFTNTVGASGWMRCVDSVAYANGSHGFNNNALSAVMIGCIAEGNTGFGFNYASSTSTFTISCATYNNTGGAYGTNIYGISNVTNTTGSFFTNAASGDFSLNNTANQGALARAANAGCNVYPLGLTTAYYDIGAAQHQDSGAGGMLFIPNMQGT